MFWLWIVLVCGTAPVAHTQVPDALKYKRTVTSLSHQFVIHTEVDPSTGVPKQSSLGEAFTYNVGGSALTLFAVREGGTTNVIDLDPKILAVTCERVKKVVLSELGMNDQWRGSVQVFVAPENRSKSQGIDIVPTRYGDGWHYKLALPQRCDWQRVVRGLVEVLLLEIANRNAGLQAVQPPLWFAEGLTGLIVAEHGRTLISEPNAFLVLTARKAERLLQPRNAFREINPPTFSELGMPDTQKLADLAAWSQFQAAAQLLTHELLQEPEGKQALQKFLHSLPQNLNWQIPFLRAFHPRFVTLLDVERWWSVAIADFQSRDPSMQWSRTRVLRQLSSIVYENTESRLGTNGPVSRQEMPISTLVSRWDFSDQREVLARKANQLQLLHLHSPPDLRPLIAEYFRVLDGYVSSRLRSGNPRDNRGEVEPRIKLIARETSRRLAQLETRIQSLKPSG